MVESGKITNLCGYKTTKIQILLSSCTTFETANFFDDLSVFSVASVLSVSSDPSDPHVSSAPSDLSDPFVSKVKLVAESINQLRSVDS